MVKKGTPEKLGFLFKLPLETTRTRDFLKVTGSLLKIGLKAPALCCKG
jgi:hypothetical protein